MQGWCCVFVFFFLQAEAGIGGGEGCVEFGGVLCGGGGGGGGLGVGGGGEASVWSQTLGLPQGSMEGGEGGARAIVWQQADPFMAPVCG